MAHYLASIYGTEKDKVNCSFYFKIGACRHGDRCSRKHIKPTFSQTILLPNFYRNPARDPDCRASSAELQDHFDDFYEDVFTDMALNYGEVDRIRICDNDGEHLSGNVYVQFRYEDDAQRAVEGLNNRYYQGRPVYAELSPVTDFHEARCRQHEFDECDRRGLCNFMHLKYPSSSLKRELQRSQELYRHERRKEERRARRGREREGEGEEEERERGRDDEYDGSSSGRRSHHRSHRDSTRSPDHEPESRRERRSRRDRSASPEPSRSPGRDVSRRNDRKTDSTPVRRSPKSVSEDSE